MGANWNALPVKLKANCVFNYNVPPTPIVAGEPTQLSLFLGDPVMILAKTDEWYYGHTLTNEAHKGVFPQSYVHLSTNEVVKEPLIEEINFSLREWFEIMKKKYLESDNQEVAVINGFSSAISSLRSNLSTGRLANREAEQVRERIVAKTDLLNHQLKLDLVVRDRDAKYRVLSPDSTSVVSLWRHHYATAYKRNTDGRPAAIDLIGPSNGSLQSQNVFRFRLQVINFKVPETIRIPKQVDLIFSLYEVADGKVRDIYSFISRIFVFRKSIQNS